MKPDQPPEFLRLELKEGSEVRVSSDEILKIIEKDPILVHDPKPQKGGFLQATIMYRDATRAKIKLKTGHTYLVEISAIK